MDYPDEKRITIFTGHFGSGKTEISINYALALKEQYEDLALVDLDFVNPYFRSREAKDYLNSRGINVIASAAEGYNSDLPALSRQIGGVLSNPDVRVVVDLGGDETGARAIGRFRSKFEDTQYDLLFVLNPFRPFTSTFEEVELIVKQIEASSRLKVTAMVSNPNLLTETTVSDILTGHDKIMQIAQALGVPVWMMAVEKIFGDLPEIKTLGLPVLKLTRQMTTPWESPNY